MARISETAEREIRILLTSWWLAVNQQLAAVTGASIQIGEAPVEMLLSSEIGLRLAHIASACEGLLEWKPDTAAAVVADCQAFQAWLNHAPITHRTPDEFWATPVGYMVLRALMWAEQDQLISLRDAAEISGMSLSVLSQRISRGQIPGYRDPKEKNPQRARRIRLSDLQQLLNEGLIRKPFSSPGFGGLSSAQTKNSRPALESNQKSGRSSP
jgi:hypothetical protein